MSENRIKKERYFNKLVRENEYELEQPTSLNADHQAGLRYAKLLQSAILSINKQLGKVMPDFFILDAPLQTVSGDFVLYLVKGNKILGFLADCTGHGVCGAMMSMVGCTLLQRMGVEKYDLLPSEVLETLHSDLSGLLSHAPEMGLGMDAALMNIDTKTHVLRFAGAKRPLYVIRDGKVIEMKGEKRALGDDYKKIIGLKNEEIQLQHNDCIYLFSDGIVDQFGGERNKKFGSKKFKSLLLSISQLPMKRQASILEEEISAWKGKEEQTDDICITGIRYSLKT